MNTSSSYIKKLIQLLQNAICKNKYEFFGLIYPYDFEKDIDINNNDTEYVKDHVCTLKDNACGMNVRLIAYLLGGPDAIQKHKHLREKIKKFNEKTTIETKEEKMVKKLKKYNKENLYQLINDLEENKKESMYIVSIDNVWRDRKNGIIGEENLGHTYIMYHYYDEKKEKK